MLILNIRSSDNKRSIDNKKSQNTKATSCIARGLSLVLYYFLCIWGVIIEKLKKVVHIFDVISNLAHDLGI